METTRTHRGLSTARATLQVTWLLARAPDGVRADQVAETLGKSTSTAYNLLASLCDEGVAERHPGGVYKLSSAFRLTVAEAGADHHDLSGVVDDLLARTHKRAYLAVLRENALRIVLERGLQGMPKLPGMEREIGENAHALALGKVVLALGPRTAVDAYARAGLKRFTSATITEPEQLHEELRRVRLTGVASECEEFERDFCCLAAPVLDHERRFLGAVGISMSRRAFDSERPRLEETLRDVVGFQRSAEIRADLDHGPRPRTPSLHPSPVSPSVRASSDLGRRHTRRRP